MRHSTIHPCNNLLNVNWLIKLTITVAEIFVRPRCIKYCATPVKNLCHFQSDFSTT